MFNNELEFGSLALESNDKKLIKQSCVNLREFIGLFDLILKNRSEDLQLPIKLFFDISVDNNYIT